MHKLTRAFLLIAGLTTAGALQAKDWPAPIQKMADQGMKIVKHFDAPSGLEGYVAKAGQTPVTLYLTPDGKHVLVGKLLDSEGRDTSHGAIEKAIDDPEEDSRWSQLESLKWLGDGSDEAKKTVYVLIDPNCPFCHHFFRDARPWVKAGKVQLRTLLVGVLEKTSPGKAAAILIADDPLKAYRRHEMNYENGGVDPIQDIPARISDQITTNNAMMTSLHIQGTPGIIYKDDKGKVHIHQGVPQGKELEKILGPKPDSDSDADDESS